MSTSNHSLKKPVSGHSYFEALFYFVGEGINFLKKLFQLQLAFKIIL